MVPYRLFVVIVAPFEGAWRNVGPGRGIAVLVGSGVAADDESHRPMTADIRGRPSWVRCFRAFRSASRSVRCVLDALRSAWTHRECRSHSPVTLGSLAAVQRPLASGRERENQTVNRNQCLTRPTPGRGVNGPHRIYAGARSSERS